MLVKTMILAGGVLLSGFLSARGEQPAAIAPAVPLLDWPFDANIPLRGLDRITSKTSDNAQLEQDAAGTGNLVDGINGTALKPNRPEGYRLHRKGNEPWAEGNRGFSLMFRIRADSYPVLRTTKGPQILTLAKETRPWFVLQYRWATSSEAAKESPEKSRVALWFRPGDTEAGILIQSDPVKAGEWVHVALTYNPDDTRAPLRLYLNGTLVYHHDRKIDFPALETMLLTPSESPECCFTGAIDDFRLYPQALYSDHVAQLAGQTPDAYSRIMKRFTPAAVEKSLIQLEDAERHRRFQLKYAPSAVATIYAELNTASVLIDGDNDGDVDLFATGTGGMCFFERVGTEMFKPSVLVESTYKGRNPTPAHTASAAGGKKGVLDGLNWYPGFVSDGFNSPREIPGLNAAKAATLYFADYNGDKKEDIVAIQTGGCFWFRNTGSDEDPAMAEGTAASTSGGIPLKVSSSAMPFDWDGDGDWDLLYQQNQGELMVYENIAAKNSFPVYSNEPAALVTEDDQPYDHFSTSVSPAIADWDGDGDNDIIITAQGGDFLWLENLGRRTASGKPAWSKRGFFKQTGGDVAYGALATPSAGDLDGDGDTDIVCGNSDGFLGWFENLTPAGADTTQWSAIHPVLSSGRPYRFTAGETLSIQGAGERKYGYTVPTVADWDMDGRLDILLNTIAGKALWLRNEGTVTDPVFGPACPVEVAWEGPPERPPWNTFMPGPRELPVQWRTSLEAVDWDRDGLTDLVIVDSEGYLAWLQRKRADGRLILLPPRRVFENTDLVFAYDFANFREFKDQNNDGWNDFRMRDSKGALVYHFRDTAAKLGRDGRNRRYNFTVTANIVDLIDPDNRNLKPLPSGTVDTFTRLTDNENRLLRLNAGWAGQSGRRKFDFADWDGDGDLDLLVNQFPYGAALLENVKQTGERAVFTDRGPLFDMQQGGHETSVTWADWNRDGIPDLLMGNEDGGLIFIERKSFQDLPGRGPGWL